MGTEAQVLAVLAWESDREDEPELASESKPVPVRVYGQVVVVGKTYTTARLEIPGVVPAVAFTDKDAFGTIFAIDVPKSGIIQSALWFDLDDEGLAMDVWLFREPFTPTTDNAAFAISDADLLKVEGVISFATTDFRDAANNQLAHRGGIAISYVAPDGRLYCQAVARGAVDIAAGKSPQFSMRIIPDAV